MTQTRGHKKNRPRAASTGEPPVSDGGPAAPASKSCEGYLSRLAKAEAVSTMPRCLPPQRTHPTRPLHPCHTTPSSPHPTCRWLVDAERHLRTSPAAKERSGA